MMIYSKLRFPDNTIQPMWRIFYIMMVEVFEDEPDSLDSLCS